MSTVLSGQDFGVLGTDGYLGALLERLLLRFCCIILYNCLQYGSRMDGLFGEASVWLLFS
jgi:hypothetical protein